MINNKKIEHFFDRIKDEKNINYTAQQREAIIQVDGPLLVLAVPGSGKTTVINGRLANLIENHGVNPDNILTVTFSKASALDMENRYKETFGGIAEHIPKFATIHSLAYNIVRYFERRTNQKFTIIEDTKVEPNKISMLKRIYLDINKEYISEDKIEELLSIIGYIKNTQISEVDFKLHDFDVRVKKFKEIYSTYEKIKKEHNLIDFDDMLVLSLEILETNQAILNQYRKQFHYIHVDEGQDTSKIQYKIIQMLAFPRQNVCIVADDDQSIYNWRGADPEFLLNFGKTYPKGKKLFMEENFRSTKKILDVANHFIKNNMERYDKQISTPNATGKQLDTVKLKNEKAQAEYIVNRIKEGESNKDFAVLYRNNSSSIYLADMLDKASIPFYVRDFKKSFFTHWVATDVLSFLRFARDNKDIRSFEKIYFKMKLYLNKNAINQIKDDNRDISVLDKLMDLHGLKGYQKEKIEDAKYLFKCIAKETPSTAIDSIVNDLQYKDFLESKSENSEYSSDGLMSIIHILKLIAEGLKTSEEFYDRLVYLYKIMDKAKFNKHKDAVTLSTLHSSKGLEFTNVMIVDMIEDHFPSADSTKAHRSGSSKLLEEERRLCYVGITRAKKEITLIYSSLKCGKIVSKSRFLDEIDKIMNPKTSKTSKDTVKTPSKESTEKTPQKILYDENSFKVNTKVLHKSLGIGTIAEITNSTYTIHFECCITKKFSIMVCLSNDLLKPIVD